MRFLLCNLLLLSNALAALALEPLDYWAWRNPTPSGNNLFSIAAGNGIYVAVGEWGTVLTSHNGVDWQDRSLSWGSISLEAVAFGNGLFVAHALQLPDEPIADALLMLLTSTDGETWNLAYTRTAPSIYNRTEVLYDIGYANGMFVAVGGNDSFVTSERTCLILTSEDGTNWETRVSASAKCLYAVTYANGRFAAVGQDDCAMASTNGVNWSAPNADYTTGYWARMDVTPFGDQFVCVGSALWSNYPSRVYTSVNGIDWQYRSTITEYGDLRTIVPYGDGLLAVGDSGKAFWSHDLMEWERVDLQTTRTIFRAELINSKTHLVGTRGFLGRGQKNVAWENSITELGPYLFSGAAFGGGRFVALSVNGRGFYSDDGAVWHEVSMPTNFRVTAVTYAAGKFVAVGQGDNIVISTNGANWRRVMGAENGIGGALRDITWDGNRFVVVADSGATHISTDGISWESNPLGYPSFSSVTAGGGLLVAGRAYHIEISSNGVNWVIQTNYSALAHEALMAGAYGQGRFVLVGEGGSAWTSTNGLDWSSTIVRPYWTFLDVVFTRDRFVAAGVGGVVFTSKDGLNWEEHLLPGPQPIYRLAYGLDTVLVAGAGALFQSDRLHEPVKTVRDARPLPNGKLRLTLLGAPGTLFDLETSSDSDRWGHLEWLFAPTGRMTYDVERTGSASYFRARP